MKLLFVHTAEKVKVDDKGNYYTDGSYNMEVWDRYLKLSKNFTIIVRKDGNKYTKEYASNKFSYIDTSRVNIVFVEDIYSGMLNFLSISKRIKNRKIIKEKVKNSEAVIARVPCNSSYYALKCAKKYNKKYIVEVVGCAFGSMWYHSLKGKVFAIIDFFKQKNVLKNSKNVIYISDFLRKRYPTRKNYAICSDVAIMQENVLNNRLEKIRKMGEKPIKFGVIGSMNVAYKGHDLAIKTLSKFKDLSFELHFLGAGDPKKWIKMAKKYGIEDKLFIDGVLPAGEQVMHWFDDIDVFLMLSKTEGLGRALIEANSRATVSIGTKVGGIPEILGEKYLVNKKSINNVKEIITQLIYDKMALEEAAKENYEMSKSFSPNILNVKREKIYREFLNT